MFEGKVLSVAVLYCEDVNLLQVQLRKWDAFPLNLKRDVVFMIIDDGSTSRAIDVINRQIPDIDLVVYRIEDELEWNIGGARNLAMFVSQTEAVFLTGVDLILEQGLLSHLYVWRSMIRDHTTKTSDLPVFVHFRRERPDGTSKPHPAAMLITKAAYWQVGGCDEDFVGHYGTTDPHFHWKMERTSGIIREVVHLSLPFVPPLHELKIAGGKGRLLDRDTSINKALFEDKKRYATWSNEYLRFKWYEGALIKCHSCARL